MHLNKAWFRALLRRRIAVILLLLLQLLLLCFFLADDSPVSEFIRIALQLISIVIVMHVISQKDKGATKVTWIFLILLFPLLGGALYLISYLQTSSSYARKRLSQIEDSPGALSKCPDAVLEQAIQDAPDQTIPMRYLQQHAGFPVFDGTQTQYYSPGEQFWQPFLEELKKAEKYIFMEYFIIEEGALWNSILEILKEKARQGVDVRILYDDIGCFLTLPKNYQKQLQGYGIRCVRFNPFRPVLTVLQNNRDHRKITSIDGKVAFTGGLNLADEYVNKVEKYGYWKDCALKVDGKAAWGLTVIFLNMWKLCTREDVRFEEYNPWRETPCPVVGTGYVQPYSDSPLDEDNVSEHVYLQILSGAKDYVYIATPYLIVDSSMISALCLAAKSGVDVRIITPHHWDKWIIHKTTQSFYRELIQGGVKIYEYSKGFIHSKIFLSDDKVATVGTVNLDFRSLYLHFECGVRMYGSEAVDQVKEDYLNTLAECEEITLQKCKANLVMRMFQNILRLFSPLM